MRRIQQAFLQRFGMGRIQVTRGLLYVIVAIIGADALMLLVVVQSLSETNLKILLITLVATHFVLVFFAIRTARYSVEEGEEKFRRIFHISPVATSITSLEDGRLLEANAAYWKLTGYDPETSIGRTTLELGLWVNKADRDKFVDRLKKQKSLHTPAYEFKNMAGQPRVTVTFYEIISLSNQPAILAMYYDVTEQRSAQLALQASEARLRALLDAIPDMIFELRRDGTILQFIPSGTSQPLLPPAEFINRNIAEVLPAVAKQTMFAIERALESGLVNAFEYDLMQTNEKRTFEARIAASGPNTVLAIVRDISLDKWAESERDKLIEELESKNAELERFTYTVSHDLKSPLITIRGFLGFLKEDTRSGNMARLDSDIQRINDATEKMQRLLNDLLELSRVGRLINEPVNVPFNTIVAEALELVHGRISQGNIAVSVRDDFPSVHGDQARLVEVMQNLIDNAAKFMGDQPAPRIEIGQRGFLRNMPIFYVRDNGIGIQSQFTENIFGLFNKLDPRSEGTGVGLALVKRIIEFHGGQIWVESEPGNGSTFCFTLQQSVDLKNEVSS